MEELPVYDLIVAGLGTAGVYAALTAAKQGLRVLGIEKLNCCGGTGTAGDVHGYYFGTPGGIYEELDEKVREMESVGYMPVVGLNPEAKKYVCEQALIDSKVEIHYESRVTGVLMEENTVCGIQWIENGEEKTALAKITLDCTGESGICDTIGCRMERGRAFDGQVQPYSVVQPEIVNGLVEFYHYLDCGYMDALDAGQYAKACVDAACLLHYNLEDYRTRRVLGISILLGLREGRRIVGEETVELQDYLEDRMTDHPAFYAYSNLDNHGRDLAFESEGLQDWLVASSLWGINISVPVSLGCCIPKGYEGILAAGRNISIGHDIASCVRQRRDMQKCGEAVGCAAALAIRKGISVREVPYEELKKQLLATGCLKKTDDSGIWDIEEGRWHRTAWLNEAGDIYQGLKPTGPALPSGPPKEWENAWNTSWKNGFRTVTGMWRETARLRLESWVTGRHCLRCGVWQRKEIPMYQRPAENTTSCGGCPPFTCWAGFGTEKLWGYWKKSWNIRRITADRNTSMIVLSVVRRNMVFSFSPMQ